jgi:hypothetical protein
VLARALMLFAAARRMLAGCDALDTFTLFDSKKKPPGDRQPVFQRCAGVTRASRPSW